LEEYRRFEEVSAQNSHSKKLATNLIFVINCLQLCWGKVGFIENKFMQCVYRLNTDIV